MVCLTPQYVPLGKLLPQSLSGTGCKSRLETGQKHVSPCQSSKIHRHIKAPLEQFGIPHRHFDHIHVDIVGPLPPSNGFTYLFTIVDRFSRWPEAIPLSDITSATCAQALISHWIARFGVPIDLSSDRGAQFTSQLWAQLLGIELHHTTAYHPQSNGLVERFHRHLKAALRARLTGPNWTAELPWVLLGIRTAPKDDLGCSSAEMVYGAPLTVPGDFFVGHNSQPEHRSQLQQLRDQVRMQVPMPTSQHGVIPSSIPPNLKQSQFVFVRRDAHRNPYNVLTKDRSKSCRQETRPSQLTEEERSHISG